jgi:hypothetical protein
MRKLFIALAGSVFAGALFFGVSYAQVVEPPINLPIYSPSATPTVTGSPDVITYYTVTPTITQTVVAAEFVDDAETGSEIYFLGFFSLVAGVGLFFIKKYFDIKRYSI